MIKSFYNVERKSSLRNASFPRGYVASDTTKVPIDCFNCQELVLCCNKTKLPLTKGWLAKYAQDDSIMLPMSREPGLNDAGMVAWLIRMRTPECPNGREVIIILYR